LGGREIRPSDIEYLLCGPQHTPVNGEEQASHATATVAAKAAAHAFHQMVRDILSRKEQDERERESEGVVQGG